MTDNDTSRWRRINEILERALDLPLDQREAFVVDSCDGDEDLAAEVRELLGYESEPADIQTRMVAAMDVLGRDMGARSSLVGTAVGPFVLTREIARGGMGLVFEGRRTAGDFEQTVAVKLLPGHRLNEDAARRFAVERRILAGLQHPNIARLIDGGTLDDGMPYIVMEFIDGVSIDQHCRRKGLSNRSIVELIVKVGDALHYAHSKLVVHRDIKPANILIDAEGTPKLLDFGIAKLMDERGDPTGEKTRTEFRLLTPAFSSPEQIKGADVTTAVDVYGLGVLTYLLLAGRLPYPAEPGNRRALEQQILERPAEAASSALIGGKRFMDADRPSGWVEEQRRGLKGDLDTILLTALRKEPERRYPSVLAFSRDLQNVLSHRPIQARPESLGYRLKLLLRRHPVALPASALALAAALIGGSVFTWLLAEERAEALASEDRALRTSEFAASLLSSTSAQEGGERLVPVSDLLDDAGERIRAELADEPLIALPMHIALGEAQLSWGRYEAGMQEGRAALELAVDNGLERDQARAYDLLARVHNDLGRNDEALAMSERSLEILMRVGSLEERARALNGMALALNEAGRREAALPIFARAEQALRELHAGDHADIAWLLNNYGWCLHALGRYEEAMERYDAALAMLDRVGNPPFDLALTISNRAGLQHDLGRPALAVEGWRQALEILQGMFGDEGHAGVARGHHLLSIGLREMGALDEALGQSRLAVAMNRRLLGDEHRWTGLALSREASLLLDRGELDAASETIDAAATVFTATGGPDHRDYTNVHFVRGRLALERNDLPTAESELRAAQALAQTHERSGRTAIDQIEWALAQALALQGDSEGRRLAESVLDRATERVGDDDWRVRLKRAGLTLPPFTTATAAEDLANAEALIDELSRLVSADAPRIRALAAQMPSRP
ncbi:MAG: tetratricopeptide repeat protein [Gammaproteobacteria bacterium]|jgi:serine/threonine-protein kinase|nr:tetratricopeptide repeat protein [Gammaproteobacteria bacterium]